MLLIPIITTICAGGTVFYFRFLIALWKECAARLRRNRSPQLRLETRMRIATKPAESGCSRAAMQFTEIPFTRSFVKSKRSSI